MKAALVVNRPQPAAHMCGQPATTRKLAGGTSVQARLYQRQLLTAGKTLVSLTVAAPEDALARCRAKDVAASLQLTGHEAARSARSTPGGPVS